MHERHLITSLLQELIVECAFKLQPVHFNIVMESGQFFVPSYVVREQRIVWLATS